LVIKALQGEGEQWECILGAADLNVGKQRIDQRVLDSERARCSIQSPCRRLYHLGIGTPRHRGQAERLLSQTFQLFSELQALVVVGSDGEQYDESWRVGRNQVAQQREEGFRLLLTVGQEQLLALVNRQNQRGGLGCGSGV